MKYEVRASKVENGTGNVVGMASIVIEDKFAVGNIRIIQKEEGGDLSIMYPARKTQKTDSGYMNIAHPYTSELSHGLKDAILESYKTGERKVVETEAVFKLGTKVDLFEKESLKAFCEVKFCDENEFAIHDITIRQGEGKDVFVAMPTYKKNDGSFGQICNPITNEFREELYNELFDSYYVAKNNKNAEKDNTIFLFQINASHNREGNYFDGEDPYREVDVYFYILDKNKKSQCINKIHKTSEYCTGGDWLFDPESDLSEINDFYKEFSAKNPNKEIIVIKLRNVYSTFNDDFINAQLEQYYKNKKNVNYEKLSHDNEKKTHKKTR